jgi:hypothetical protein
MAANPAYEKIYTLPIASVEPNSSFSVEASMSHAQVLAVALCLGVGLTNNSANAGWFGPRNFEECVIDKMDGKASYLLPTVRGLCDKLFPCEKDEKYLACRPGDTLCLIVACSRL